MKTVVPYLMFNGNCEEAFNFYKEVFGGQLEITRFRDMGEDPNNPLSNADKELIANVSLNLNGTDQQIMGSDVPSFMPQSKAGDNFSIMLDCDSTNEVDQLHESLRDGSSTMAPQETEWADKFAICTDKFGTSWMLNYTGNKVA